jgi:amino acid adenylation domain-containing protein
VAHNLILLKEQQVTSLAKIAQDNSLAPESILFATYIRVLNLINNTMKVDAGYLSSSLGYGSDLNETSFSSINESSAVNMSLTKDMSWMDLIVNCDSVLKEIDKKAGVESQNDASNSNKITLFQTAFEVMETADNDSSVPKFYEAYSKQFGLDFPLLLSCNKVNSKQIDLVNFFYNPDYYDSQRITKFGEYFLKAIDSLIDDRSSSFLNESLISSVEIEELIKVGSGEVIKLKEESALQVINNSLEKNANKILLEDQHRTMSGVEVLSRVNDLIDQLHLKSFKQKVVAVSLPRGNDWVCSLVSIMSEGAIYLPIDLTVPPARISTILSEAKAAAIICSDDQVGLLKDVTIETNIELLVTPDYSEQERKLTVNAKWDDKAYVLFTSGSTGVPKGALLEHSGMANHLVSKVVDLDLTSNDVIAQTAPVTFDISVWQGLIGLHCGAKTVVYSKYQQLSIASFFDQINKDQVTVLEVVPSYFSLVLDYLSQNTISLEFLRMMVLTGEPLKHEQVKRWFGLYPEIEIVNAYGPTECSDDITHHRFQVAPENNIVPIGKPICNMRIHILDSNDDYVPYGTLGDICVSGVGVGLGYINSDEKTTQAFDFHHELAQWSTGRLYRTGDIGRWGANGELEYFGRHEDQIKIRGMRVELGEIENAILEVPDIKDAAVVFEQDIQTLTGYYIGDVEKELIFESLVKILPSFMVPKSFIACESFPLNSAGKTDKKQLLKITDNTVEQPKKLIPLATETEKQIADIWATLLNVDVATIDKSSNFFHLGGDSLLAAAAVSLLDGVCTLNDFYTYQNLEQLASKSKSELCESQSYAQQTETIEA